MRLPLEIRKSIADAIKRGIPKKLVAKVIGSSRTTVWTWGKRSKQKKGFKDKPRKPKQGKVTVEIRISILNLRNIFGWGSARIQQGLMCLPEFMLKEIPFCVQGVKLSRMTINNVLKQHGMNGYEKKHKSWKFFRAKEPDELWQLDIKGPFTVQGKKYWLIVCVDDYSRYLLLAEQLDHCPTTKEIAEILSELTNKLGRRPKCILTDNGGQFKRQWKAWCKSRNIDPLFAHPHYPQDKGKVERAIRTLAEEFVKLLSKFPHWVKGKIKEYQEWFNEKRFHRGILCMPAQLYLC